MIGHVLWQMFDWPGGNVLGNILASIICGIAVWVFALRHFECSQPRCLRPGRHGVDGTTYHTCRKHTTGAFHDALKARHAVRHPEQHEHLN